LPKTKLLFFQENGRSPVYEWLNELRRSDLKAYTTGLARIDMLMDFGHDLRRPVAAYLRDGIFELRWKHGHVQYRVLYFFHGRDAAVLTHGIVKEAAIDDVEIERALQRKAKFIQSPQRYGLEKELLHD
jgi:putative component of toxin-antitoxin plasmid stabilization module